MPLNTVYCKVSSVLMYYREFEKPTQTASLTRNIYAIRIILIFMHYQLNKYSLGTVVKPVKMR